MEQFCGFDKIKTDSETSSGWRSGRWCCLLRLFAADYNGRVSGLMCYGNLMDFVFLLKE